MNEWIFIWAIVFAVFNGALATRRNRSVVAWSVMGVLFGVFSFILLLLLPTVREK
jgi:hypothetical protein